MTFFGTISEIWRYPVSSVGGERLDAAELDAGGLRGDRTWGVVDLRDGSVAGPEGRRHWRSLPNLHARLAGDWPEISSGDTWRPAGEPEANALLSDFLGFPAALRPHTAFEHTEEGHVAPRYQRDDLHILTTMAMDTLAGLLPDDVEIDARRFRPNIVIEAPDAPAGFVANHLIGRTLAIGDVRILIKEPCKRCAFTSIAQGNLSFAPAVLQTIASKGTGGFGELCTVTRPGQVRVGDEISLTDA